MQLRQYRYRLLLSQFQSLGRGNVFGLPFHRKECHLTGRLAEHLDTPVSQFQTGNTGFIAYS
jgi:hypothetical protein